MIITGSEKLQIKLLFSNTRESVAAICRFFFTSSASCNKFLHARYSCRHSPPGEKSVIRFLVREGEQKRPGKEEDSVPGKQLPRGNDPREVTGDSSAAFQEKSVDHFKLKYFSVSNIDPKYIVLTFALEVGNFD